MYCKKCGQEIDEKAEICPKCGVHVRPVNDIGQFFCKKMLDKEGIISPVAFFLIIAGFGFIGNFIFALQAKSINEVISVLGTGFLIALASLLVGGLLGFVFGIPRSLQKEQTTEYQENTNLEQISDWLTKILVGVGLVQITLFWQEIPKIAAYISPALGGFSSSGIFGIAIIFYFLIDGFFVGYLWTRLSMAQTMKEHKQRLERGAKYQSDLDALEALDSALKDSKKISIDDLLKKFKESSNNMLDLIYYKIDEFWHQHDYSKQESRIVFPILKALIDSRDYSPYWLHASLAFAYMEQTPPNYTEASKKYTEAIGIRGIPHSREDYEFELRRAICNIHSNKDEESILEDLSTADKFYFPGWDNEEFDKTIKGWLYDNKALIDTNDKYREIIKKWQSYTYSVPLDDTVLPKTPTSEQEVKMNHHASKNSDQKI